MRCGCFSLSSLTADTGCDLFLWLFAPFIWLSTPSGTWYASLALIPFSSYQYLGIYQGYFLLLKQVSSSTSATFIQMIMITMTDTFRKFPVVKYTSFWFLPWPPIFNLKTNQHTLCIIYWYMIDEQKIQRKQHVYIQL
jgi:hypothetical protein